MGMERAWDRLPDDDLLAAARKDGEAFATFYRRHEERVLAFFLARAGDPEVAADLTAETFAAALVSSGRFRRRREPATAWLFGIARNLLAMSRRRGRVEARARQRLGMPRLELTDELIERIEALSGKALGLVEELPPDQRDAVRARVVDERDYGEIARDLRCSEAVVRKRVSRGLAGLRERMEETP
jgi:RNA polymerase sigma factor (sigma-70 family)